MKNFKSKSQGIRASYQVPFYFVTVNFDLQYACAGHYFLLCVRIVFDSVGSLCLD